MTGGEWAACGEREERGERTSVTRRERRVCDAGSEWREGRGEIERREKGEKEERG